MKERKSVLMLVEPNFHKHHVGVRRVIRYHWKDLEAQGHTVTLAAPHKGRWISCSAAIASALMASPHAAVAPTQIDPTWRSGEPPLLTLPSAASNIDHQPLMGEPWRGPPVSARDYDDSILTTPWMCAGHNLPQERYSLGIVYDMVPNLIALGVLRLPSFANVYHFAYQHSMGYEFYLQHARTISCISESTRNDFVSLYGETHRTEVCIPFNDFGNGEVTQPELATDVLLINALDPRKNFSTIAKTLKEAARHTSLNVTVVGRERMPFAEVTSFLAEIAAVCANVQWYRSPSDVELEVLMQRARVLFFPSIYEGLGLPILEAQAKGIPVISSNTSSCSEINLNPQLMADPYNHHAFATQLAGLVNNTLPVLAGPALREQQAHLLQNHNRLSLCGLALAC